MPTTINPVSLRVSSTVRTPWGIADHVTPLNDGALIASTPSHGGLFLPPRLHQKMPESARQTPYSSGGWYEEDADIALPCAILGEEIGIQPDRIAMCRDYIRKDSRYLGPLVPESIKESWPK